MNIEFGTPPELPPAGRTDIDAFVEALQKRPGEWGKYPQKVTRSYRYALMRKMRERAGEQFEFIAQPAGLDGDTDDSVVQVWARWVG